MENSKKASTLKDLDAKEINGFKVGQLIKVGVGEFIEPWNKSSNKVIGIITGFFVLTGTDEKVAGSPVASKSIGAHILIGSTAYKFHISHLTPYKKAIEKK